MNNAGPLRRPPLRVGERVKLVSIPDSVLKDLDEADVAFLRTMIGKRVPVMAMNARGEVMVEFGTREQILHMIWVPQACIRRLGAGFATGPQKN